MKTNHQERLLFGITGISTEHEIKLGIILERVCDAECKFIYILLYAQEDHSFSKIFISHSKAMKKRTLCSSYLSILCLS